MTIHRRPTPTISTSQTTRGHRIRSSGFSHLRPEIFQISLWTPETRHTQPRGQEKRRKIYHRLVLDPSARREMFVKLFLQLSVHLQAIASVYSSEIPTKPLTHLMLTNLASETTHPSSRLLSPADCLVLSPLDCRIPPTSVDCPVLCLVSFLRFC